MIQDLEGLYGDGLRTSPASLSLREERHVVRMPRAARVCANDCRPQLYGGAGVPTGQRSGSRPNCTLGSPIVRRARKKSYRLNRFLPLLICMTRAISELEELTKRQESDRPDPGVCSHGQVHLDVRCGCEIRQQVEISATPPIVFAFLTDAERMMVWLARDVEPDARSGGVFRLADFNGLWIEGKYLKVIPHRTVVFTWGGFEGLKVGESTVEFDLDGDGERTLVASFRPL